MAWADMGIFGGFTNDLALEWLKWVYKIGGLAWYGFFYFKNSTFIDHI
jgi:hypothetical protein